MNIKGFSVLMSVYQGERAYFLEQSINSIINQTRQPKEIVIVCDGKLTEELESVLEFFCVTYPNLFIIVKYSQNKGLGRALNIGLENCKYEYVARMDTDDIAIENRFERQIKFLEHNPDIAILGCNIAEFVDDTEKIISYRRVPTEYNDIIKYAHKRNPFNHMTVVFKKSVVLNVGGYQDMPLAEDYYLWARILNNGYKVANINECLVFARAGDDMIIRRSGLAYAKKINKLRYSLYKIGFIHFFEYLIYSSLHCLVAICPMSIKRYIYTYILHKPE